MSDEKHEIDPANIVRCEELKEEKVDVLKQAEVFRNKSKYIQAIPLYAQLIEEDECDEISKVRALYGLARCEYGLGRYRESLEHSMREVEIAKMLGEKEAEGLGHVVIGNCLRSLSRFSEAIDSYQTHISLATQLEQQTHTTPETENNDFPDHQSKPHLFKISVGQSNWIASQCSALGGLGKCEYGLGNYMRSIEYHQKQVSVGDSAGLVKAKCEGVGGIAHAYLGMCDYHKAIEYYTLKLELAKQIPEPAAECTALYGLGQCHCALGQYSLAIRFHEDQLTLAQSISSPRRQAQAWEGLGRCREGLGAYGKAVQCFENQLSIARQIGDRHAEITALEQLGSCHTFIADFQSAIKCFQETLSVSKQIGAKQTEMRTLNGIGRTHLSLGQWHTAAEYFELANSLAVKIGDKVAEGYTHCHLGDCLFNLYTQVSLDPSSAPPHPFSSSLSTSPVIPRSFPTSGSLSEFPPSGSGSETPISAANGGVSFWTTSIEKQAKKLNFGGPFSYLHSARFSYERFLQIAVGTGNKQAEGLARSSLGRCFLALSDPEKGKEFFEQDLCISREISDVAGQCRALTNLSMCYTFFSPSSLEKDCCEFTSLQKNNFSISQTKNLSTPNDNDLKIAIDYLLEAKLLAEQSGRIQSLAEILSILGWIYLWQDLPISAESVLRECIERAEQMTDRSGLQDDFKVSLADTLSVAYQRLQVALMAQEGKEVEALAVAERGRGRACAQALLAKSKEDPTPPVLTPDDILKLSSNHPNKTFIVFSEVKEPCLPSPQGSPPTPTLPASLNKKNNTPTTTTNCFSLFHGGVSTPIPPDSAPAPKSPTVRNIFGQPLGKTPPPLSGKIENRDLRRKKSIFDSTKSFIYCWVLGDDSVKFSKIPLGEISQGSLSNLSAALAKNKTLLRGSPCTPPFSELRRAFLSGKFGASASAPPTDDGYQSPSVVTEILSPPTAFPTENLREEEIGGPISSGDIQKTQQGGNQRILKHLKIEKEHFEIQDLDDHDHDSEIFSSKREEESCEDETPLSRSYKMDESENEEEDAQEIATRLGKELTCPISRKSGKSNSDELHQLMQSLYSCLISPIIDFLPKIQNPHLIDANANVPHLVIIPQGSLNIVPFCALQNPLDDSFLIDWFMISVCPSLLVHDLVVAPRPSKHASSSSQREAEAEGESLEKKFQAVVVGNPQPMPVHPKFKSQMHPLPSAEIEALAISRLLRVSPLIGKEAKEREVCERMKNATVMHFATHGLLDKDEIQSDSIHPGALVLCSDGSGSGGSTSEFGESSSSAESGSESESPLMASGDGFLRSCEITKMELREAELVVLSACQTGCGRLSSDGVLGLPRAFLIAGARAVAVSLWSVPDESTATLMKIFYEFLFKDSDWPNEFSPKPGEICGALRRAMLSVKAMPEFASPKNWGAFTVVGNG